MIGDCAVDVNGPVMYRQVEDCGGDFSRDPSSAVKGLRAIIDKSRNYDLDHVTTRTSN